MESYFLSSKEEELPNLLFYLCTMTSSPVASFWKFGELMPDYFPYKLDSVQEATAVIGQTWRIPVDTEETKMVALKKRFKEKLDVAKKLREKVGGPIALGNSIIEIPEDEADKKLSNFKGYRYVSKKP